MFALILVDFYIIGNSYSDSARGVTLLFTHLPPYLQQRKRQMSVTITETAHLFSGISTGLTSGFTENKQTISPTHSSLISTLLYEKQLLKQNMLSLFKMLYALAGKNSFHLS